MSLPHGLSPRNAGITVNYAAIRKHLQTHPALTTTLIAGCLLISLVIQLYRCTGRITDSTQADGVYYYDLAAGKLYTAPGAQILPVATTSTAKPDNDTGGVIAIVYGCGNCQNASDRFIGYVISHNPDVIAQLKPEWSVGARLMALGENPKGVLIKRFNNQTHQPEGPWYYRRGNEGTKIVESVIRQPPCEAGVRAIQCGP